MDSETVKGISEAEQTLDPEQTILTLKLMLQSANERCSVLSMLNEANEAELGRRQERIIELEDRCRELTNEIDDLEHELVGVSAFSH